MAEIGLPWRECQADSRARVQVGERRGRATSQGGRQEREDCASNLEEITDGPTHNRTG